MIRGEMSERKMTARTAVMEALQPVGERFTVQALAMKTGRAPNYVLSILYGLHEDEVVDRRLIGSDDIQRKRYSWALTGKPLPAQAEASRRDSIDRYNARPLMEALGMPLRPRLVANARVAVLEGKRV